MTDMIRAEGLLPAEEIDQLWNDVPKELLRYQEAYAAGVPVDTFSQFIQIKTAVE
jgi:hypothetical protein